MMARCQLAPPCRRWFEALDAQRNEPASMMSPSKGIARQRLPRTGREKGLVRMNNVPTRKKRRRALQSKSRVVFTSRQSERRQDNKLEGEF